MNLFYNDGLAVGGRSLEFCLHFEFFAWFGGNDVMSSRAISKSPPVHDLKMSLELLD